MRITNTNVRPYRHFRANLKDNLRGKIHRFKIIRHLIMNFCTKRRMERIRSLMFNARNLRSNNKHRRGISNANLNRLRRFNLKTRRFTKMRLRTMLITRLLISMINGNFRSGVVQVNLKLRVTSTRSLTIIAKTNATTNGRRTTNRYHHTRRQRGHSSLRR